MSGDRTITRVPEAQWVEVPPEFALSARCRADAGEVGLVLRVEPDGRAFLTCTGDTQSVLAIATARGPYVVRVRDLEAGVVSHMIQQHGWTREGNPLHG